MKRIISFKKSHYLALYSVLTLSLMACKPQPLKSMIDIKPQSKLNSLSEGASTCEAQLRQKMLNKTLTFSEIEGFGDRIAKINSELSQLDQDVYEIRQAKKEIISVGVHHYHNFGLSDLSSVQYELTRPEADSEDLLSLSIKMVVLNKNLDSSLTQHFRVSKDCKLSYTKTIDEKLEKKTATEYEYFNKSFFVDGGHNTLEDRFKLSPEAVILNFYSEYSDFSVIPQSGFSYMGQIGLADYVRQDQPDFQAKEFGLDLNFKNFVIELKLKGKPIAKMIFGEDQNQKIRMSDVINIKKWRLSKEIWTTQNLGDSSSASSLVQYDLPKDYLLMNSSIQLIANQIVPYENFAAYWTVVQKESDVKTKRLKMLLTQSSLPTVAGVTTSADLVSNATIQTDHPQVQKIAQLIREQTNDRTSQVGLILDYLATNYVYDHEMLKNNVIRALTANDALQRGKGVCQHYAVIFASVARALNIPTRIISGYMILDSAVMHAWNEVELTPGYWTVIEPQSKSSLTNMPTRLYLPLTRAYDLEDKDTRSAEATSAILNTDIILKPAQ